MKKVSTELEIILLLHAKTLRNCKIFTRFFISPGKISAHFCCHLHSSNLGQTFIAPVWQIEVSPLV